MNSLDEYISLKHKNDPKWFINEVHSVSNQDTVNDVKEIRNYLDGSHEILNTKSYQYGGEWYHPKRTVLQTANTLLQFQRQHLLHNPVTLTGGSERAVEIIGNINKKGKYERFNRKILDKVLTYGTVYEYVYRDGDIIKSKLIDPDKGVPIYDKEQNLISFVEFYEYDGVAYYNVFKENVVEQYSYKNGKLQWLSRYNNLSGLPIVYRSENEQSDVKGRSQLKDWMPLLDAQESLLSRYQDSVETYVLRPIPVISGQQIKDSLPSEILKAGLTLDDGASFSLATTTLDYQSFNAIYEKLMQSLLDISATPSIALNKGEISNISSTSIKMMYSLANSKASINQQILEDGFFERMEKFRELLKYDGITFDDDEFETLDNYFQYNIPANLSELLDNLGKLKELGAISMETLLEKAPYIDDVAIEIERLKREGNPDTEQDNEIEDVVTEVV